MKKLFLFLLIVFSCGYLTISFSNISNEKFFNKFIDEKEKILSMQDQKIQFADNVRIISSPETERLGIANKHGQVYGETTPSSTGIKIIGKLADDYALNIFVEDMDKDFWLSPNLIELVDKGAGTEISIGNKHAIKQEDGSWKEINK